MKRRKLVALLATALPPMALFVACTFPDVGFSPGGNEGGSSDAPSGGDSPSTDGGGTADAPITDAPVRTDAEQKVDAASCDLATNCDCDHDGYRRAGFTGVCDAGAGPDSGVDCDDLDPIRHPGQKEFIREEPDPGLPSGGDWNCDGKVEKEYSETYTCSVAFCGATGFKTEVPCGKQAPFFKCEGNPVCSSNQESVPRTQGCR